ncbi:MAG: N-acetyltransferase [Anaerolineae bacterium]|nr:N-acetyltransferase [Anaerolineae bacterium]
MMQKEEFIIREIDMPADAEKLVEMWKASDDQWPGTMSHGVEITTQWVMEMHERQKMLNVYVAETADKSKIVGYCSLCERESEKNTGYLATLNVQPDYQRKSLGRRLVQQCVERCTELGFHLLSINTWSANLKSVPTYKKCGYFWVPDTSVYMLNFIPPIRQLSCAQPYFSRHNWYTTFRREFKQEEDDQRWEGMKVFIYHWEEDGDALTVWADREAQRITAVETDAFFAAAIAGDIEPARGLSTTIRWRLTNKQAQPMHISLIASGTDTLKVDKRATLVLAPGETWEFESPVDIALDTPDVKSGQPVPSVRTLFIINGEVLELGTGMRPRKAVEVRTTPEYVTLFPGVAKTVHIQLQSHLKADMEATVSLSPALGLTTAWTESSVTIPAKSFAALPVSLQAEAEGVYPLLVTVYFKGGQTKPERLAIFNLGAGEVLADHGEKETRLENEWTRIIVKSRAGDMQFTAVQTGAVLGSFREVVGPPFWPSELDEKDFSVTLQKTDGRLKAILSADMNDRAGMTLRREVTLGGGPLVEIASTLVNKGPHTHQLQLSRRVYIWQEDLVTLTLPLKEGLVQTRYSEMPDGSEDISRRPEAFAERWGVLSSERGMLGVLWDDTVEENEFSWSVGLNSKVLACGPQQWTPAGTLHLYIGPGDWRTVRAHARRLAGQDTIPEPIPVEVRKVYNARLEPSPLVTLEDTAATTLVVDNLRGKPLEGGVTLVLPEGLAVDKSTFELHDVSIKNTLREAVTLTLPSEATAYTAAAHLQTRIFNVNVAVPVIRLGNRAAVDVVQDNGTFMLDNGRTCFGVAPDFSAALFQWEEGGVNHALSPYPKQSIFDWMNPWYGGLMPIVLRPGDNDFPGKLHRETFTGEVIDLPDARGIPWRGARMSSVLQRERLLGLCMDIDYLTVGNSNVLKVIYRVHNMTTAWRHFTLGCLSFWQPDGTSEHNVLHIEGMERKPNPWISWAETPYWVSVTNGETGRTLIQVSPYPSARYIDWSTGGHLAWFNDVDIPPEGVLERILYLVLCRDLAEAKRYIALKDYK